MWVVFTTLSVIYLVEMSNFSVFTLLENLFFGFLFWTLFAQIYTMS